MEKRGRTDQWHKERKRKRARFDEWCLARHISRARSRSVG